MGLTRGWRLLILMPVLAWLLAFGLAMLTKIRVPFIGRAADLFFGAMLVMGFPALAGGLCGKQLGPDGESRWLHAVFGSWPALALMMLVLAGFSGSVLFFFAYAGVVVFPLAGLAGGIVHAIQLARVRRRAPAP